MKKLLIFSIAVFCVNLTVGFLALFAFLLFLTRFDPIMASVPAMFAIIGILPQPWYILFLFLPGGLLLLAPLLTTAVTVTVYGTLDRLGWLERVKPILRKMLSLRFILFAVVLAGLSLVVMYARYRDFPPLRSGMPETLERNIGDLGLTVESSRYYCLGAFIDTEWIWQARVSEADFNHLISHLEMTPVDREQVSSNFLQMPPYWWNPVISEHTKVFKTSLFSMDGRGHDGWHAMATWDPENEVLYLWIKDNF